MYQRYHQERDVVEKLLKSKETFSARWGDVVSQCCSHALFSIALTYMIMVGDKLDGKSQKWKNLGRLMVWELRLDSIPFLLTVIIILRGIMAEYQGLITAYRSSPDDEEEEE